MGASAHQQPGAQGVVATETRSPKAWAIARDARMIPSRNWPRITRTTAVNPSIVEHSWFLRADNGHPLVASSSGYPLSALVWVGCGDTRDTAGLEDSARRVRSRLCVMGHSSGR